MCSAILIYNAWQFFSHFPCLILPVWQFKGWLLLAPSILHRCFRLSYQDTGSNMDQITQVAGSTAQFNYKANFLLLSTKIPGMCVCACVRACVLVAQSCPSLCDPTDCSPPGSSIHEFSVQEYWSEVTFPSPRDLPDPGIKPGSLALHSDSLLSELIQIAK